jgi:hypothetical protein
LTKPRYNHSVNNNQEEEDRLQDVLTRRETTFVKLVKWAVKEQLDRLDRGTK